MTMPALMWRATNEGEPTGCSYPGCGAVAVAARGPRIKMTASPAWRAYCRAHASMYGVTLRRGKAITRLGR